MYKVIIKEKDTRPLYSLVAELAMWVIMWRCMFCRRWNRSPHTTQLYLHTTLHCTVTVDTAAYRPLLHTTLQQHSLGTNTSTFVTFQLFWNTQISSRCLCFVPFLVGSGLGLSFLLWARPVPASRPAPPRSSRPPPRPQSPPPPPAHNSETAGLGGAGAGLTWDHAWQAGLDRQTER